MPFSNYLITRRLSVKNILSSSFFSTFVSLFQLYYNFLCTPDRINKRQGLITKSRYPPHTELKPRVTHSKSVTLLLTLCLFTPLQSNAQQTILLATTEREPYIGNTLHNQGYVHELITEVFKRINNEVIINYYPLTRSKKLSRDGKVNGWLPSYYDHSQEKHYLYSDPFPGDNIGLLKKKSLPALYTADPRFHLTEALQYFKSYAFGVVRGTSILPDITQDTSIQKLYVTKDLQNLDILYADRVDLALIDKYTAADLMVGLRPHLIGQLEFMRPPIISNSFHIAFSKKSPGYQQLTKRFNQGLKSVKEDGTLKKILNKHGLFPEKKNKPGKTILTIGTVNNRDMIVMQRLSNVFEKQYPHIELEWRVLEENILRRRLLSDLAIDDGQFDIMTIGSLEAPIWGEKGWLTPLENLPTEYHLDDILETVQKTLSHKKKLYALPFYSESSMTFYRKDIFKKFGLVMPQHPTYQDITKFAAAIHNPRDDFYGICLRGKAGWGANMALIGTMINAYGGRWFDQYWRPTINSPSWKQALSTYKTLITQYGPPQATSNGFNENLKLFSDGQCGIWIDATVAASFLSNPKLSKVSHQLGFTNAPIAKTSKGSHWLWIWALAIPDSSTHKKEALQFITWATSKNYIRSVAKEEGWVAVPPGTRKSTYTNKHYQAAAPFANTVLKAIQTADPIDSTLEPNPYTGIQMVTIAEFPSIGNQVSLIIVKFIEGKISIDQALYDSQKLVEKQMKKSGY